jgi:hypothetical protein
MIALPSSTSFKGPVVDVPIWGQIEFLAGMGKNFVTKGLVQE